MVKYRISTGLLRVYCRFMAVMRVYCGFMIVMRVYDCNAGLVPTLCRTGAHSVKIREFSKINDFSVNFLKIREFSKINDFPVVFPNSGNWTRSGPTRTRTTVGH